MAINEGARQSDEAIVVSILPDWCKVGTRVVPFTITAKLDLSVRTASNVYFKKKNVFTMESRVVRVEGDEGEGLFSGCSKGFCRPITAATKVRARNSYVVHHTSKFHMNSATPDSTPNTIGKLVYIRIGTAEVTQQTSDADIADAKKLMNDALKKHDRGWWSHRRITPEFEKRVGEIATEFGIAPNDLMAVFNVETVGTFSPTIQNPFNGASGLIQFTGTTAASMLGHPATAAGRQAALEQVRGMTNTQQLELVRQYLLPYKDKIAGHGIDGLYMTVFTGKPRIDLAGDGTLYSQGSTAYAQNQVYDLNGDGVITKDEALSKVRKDIERQNAKEAQYQRIQEGVKVTGGF
jgi:hypothetical protein